MEECLFATGLEDSCCVGLASTANILIRLRGLYSDVSHIEGRIGEGELCDVESVYSYAYGWNAWVVFGGGFGPEHKPGFLRGYQDAADANERGGERPTSIGRETLGDYGME
jgi:hypothetical protein